MAGLHKLARVKQITKRTVSQMVLFAVPLVKSINCVSLPSPIRKKKENTSTSCYTMLKKHQTVARCRATVFIKFSSIIKDPVIKPISTSTRAIICLTHLTITTGWFYYTSLQLPYISNNFPNIAKSVLRPLNTYELVEHFLMAFKHIAQISGHFYIKETEKIAHKTRHEVTLF